jgi:hypothetical protein
MTHPTHKPGRIMDPRTALAFIVGGKAIFTLVSGVTGVRYTYKVSPGSRGNFWVSSLIGSNNETDYKYIGYLNPLGRRGLLCGTVGQSGAKQYKALTWLLKALSRGRMPDEVEFWHAGKCAKCSRKLTDPASIARGFGPTCFIYQSELPNV